METNKKSPGVRTLFLISRTERTLGGLEPGSSPGPGPGLPRLQHTSRRLRPDVRLLTGGPVWCFMELPPQIQAFPGVHAGALRSCTFGCRDSHSGDGRSAHGPGDKKGRKSQKWKVGGRDGQTATR